MDASTIYQRTDSGRDTIKTKSQKLTQSERMLLIIIDGVTPIEVLRKEIWSLSADRFERAMKTLLKKELISEVFLPIPGQEAEHLDTDIVNHFLEQDALDPVTIISFDPEDEFGVNFNPFAPVAASAPVHVEVDAPAAELAVAQPMAGAAGAEFAVAGPEVSAAQPEVAVMEPVVASTPIETVVPVEAPMEERQPTKAELENLALKSLSIELEHDKLHEADRTFAQPPLAMPQMIAPELIPNLSDEWPEDLELVSVKSSKWQWIYWAALISGIGIILLSLLYRILA